MFITLFFALVIGLMLYLRIIIINKSLWGGLFIISVAQAMLILSILKFKKSIPVKEVIHP